METTKHLRGLGYANPIVALTANAVAGQSEIFMQNGFDDFITKPIDLRQLNAVLNRLIRDKYPKDVVDAARRQAKNDEGIYVLDGHVIQINVDESESMAFNQTGSSLSNKKITGLDIAKGIERYSGDEGTYLKVLRSYAASVRSMLSTIANVSEDDLQDYKIKVHGIKGASLDIFSEQIGKSAAELENAAKSGDFAYISKHNSAFLHAARKHVDDLDNMLSAIDAENPKPKKDKPDGELLSKLLTACTAYDLNEVDAAMEEIEKHQYESDGGLSDWLRENVDMMDFEQIVQKLSDENQ